MSSCTGALLILGGLMLNLVASGMLLRPINVRPSISSPPSSPSIQKGQCAILNGQEKEPLKNGVNGSSPLANGIAKADSSPSTTWGPEIVAQGRKTLTNVEVSQPVHNGVNGLEGDCCKTGDAPLERNGGSAGTDAALRERASNENSPKKDTQNSSKALDFSLLKNPFFCIYTWSLVFSQLAYFIPYFHLSARARNLGIEPMDASFIISLAGEFFPFPLCQCCCSLFCSH